MVGIREILDVEAHLLISSHHWERLIVNISCNATLCHPLDHLVCLLTSLTKKTNNVEVTARTVVLAIVVQNCNIEIGKCSIHPLNHFLAFSKHLRITLELDQTQCSHHISHVALKPWTHNVVLPSTHLRFRQRILVLTMKRK